MAFKFCIKLICLCLYVKKKYWPMTLHNWVLWLLFKIFFWWTSIYILHANEMNFKFCMSKEMWWECLSKHVFWHYMCEWLFFHLVGFSTNLMVPFVVSLWPSHQIVNPPRLGSNVVLIQRHPFHINNMWWFLWYHVWVWVTFANMKGVHDIICQVVWTMWVSVRKTHCNFLRSISLSNNETFIHV